MRRLLTLATISALAATSLTPAHAATKAGATCTKLNSTAKAGSTTLKCTKVGKKLIWQTQALPKTTPTPSPTQTPTALPYFNEEAAKAFASVRAVLATSPSATASLAYYESPTIAPARVAIIQKSLQTAIDFWSPQFIQTKAIPTFFLTEQDKDWFFAKLNTFGFHPDTITHMTKNWENMVGPAGDQVTWAGVYGRGGGDAFNFYVQGTRAKEDTAGWIQVAPHEWTHSVQNNAADQFPCWFAEGQATYYGLALAASSEKHFSQIRREYFNPDGDIDIRKDPTGGWESWIESRSLPEADINCGSNGAYTVGAILTEYMLSLKGHKGITDFMGSTRADGWQKALGKVYEISWANFKIDGGKYIVKVARSLNY